MSNMQIPWQAYSDPERKRLYASLAHVRPDTEAGRYEAACLTFPEDAYNNLVWKAVQEYPYDKIVIEETARLQSTQTENTLPSRAEQARDIYNLARGAKTVDDMLKAHKLYAELMGYIQKPNAAGGNVVINNRVMVMPALPSNDDEWEQQAVAQQAKLVEHAAG